MARVERKFYLSEETDAALRRLSVITGQNGPAAQLTWLIYWWEELELSVLDQKGIELYERRKLTPLARIASQRRKEQADEARKKINGDTRAQPVEAA